MKRLREKGKKEIPLMRKMKEQRSLIRKRKEVKITDENQERSNVH
jgi:hypothetical protein